MIRRSLPQRRHAETFTLTACNQNLTVTLGYYNDGALAEVFVDVGKSGTDIASVAGDAGVLLKHGASIEAIRHAVTRNASGEAASILGAVADHPPTISKFPGPK